MVKIDLPYIDRVKDRYGNVRYYYRRRLGKRTPLPHPSSPDFVAAYEAAAGKSQARPKVAGVRTIEALITSYFQSSEYTELKPSTKSKYQGACQWLRERYGPLPVAGMRRKDVLKIRQRKAKDGAAAANTMLKVIRVLVRHAFDLEWLEIDPTAKVRKLKEGTYHTWTEAEIAQFEAHWTPGSRERLAFALALYTGQRRADIAGMTWADVDRQSWTVRVVQEKTGTKLTIPVHPALRSLLAGMERQIAIVARPDGARMTTESLGNAMADAIDAAGLPKRCVLHGLRKAAARRLAEAGCSAKEIAAITGHKTLSEVERYTEAAAQEGLAERAVLKLRRE